MKRRYRNEIKYIISSGVAKELKYKLKPLLDFDPNADENGVYTIKSLYFDDPDNTAFAEKLDGVLYRKKYRIRTYNDSDAIINLERKYKHNNLTSKDQMLISKEIYSKIIDGNIDDIDISQDNLLSQFIAEIKVKHLMPSVIVEYKRTVFTYPLSTVRVTLDEKVKSGRYNYDLFEEGIPEYRVMKADEPFSEYVASELEYIMSRDGAPAIKM